MVLSTLLASALLASWSPTAGGDEWLYAQTGNGLQVYDPETGEHLQSWYIPSLINNRGLVYDSGRLYMLNQNLLIWRDFMVELHPATAGYVEFGKTGFSIGWGDVSLVRDPATDTYYVLAASEIYEVDMTTGMHTYLGRLQQHGVTTITAIAIDSRGDVIGYGAPSLWYPKAAFYNLDLESGRLERIGDLKGNPLLFTTLAFDSQDRLWGAGIGPFSFQDYRLHRIDLETFELIQTFSFPEEWPSVSAIAFGPKPDVTSYCEPKTNSAGCTPAIGWKGHPSASARFGFEVRATQVVPDSPGFLMLGFGGQASVPFQGGTLCVAEPTLRTTPQVSGSEVGCSSSWSLDVNTWLFGNHPLAPGDRFTCQWWGRDPGLIGPESSQLSDALEVVLLP
jgi:hypothetical protein